MIKLKGKTFDFSIRARDLIRAQSNGCDLGDLRNEKLQRVLIDPIAAIEAAFWVYRPSLSDNGIESVEDLADAIEVEDLGRFHNEFAESLTRFFPTARLILAEIRAVQAEAESSIPSGQDSGKPLGS